MKITIVVFCYLISPLSFCQTPEVTKLLKRRAYFNDQIKVLDDSIKNIDKKIKLATAQFKYSDGFKAVISQDVVATLVVSDKTQSTGMFQKGDTVLLSDVKDWDFWTSDGNVSGYVNMIYFQKSKELDLYFEAATNRALQQQQKEQIAQEKHKEDLYNAQLKKEREKRIQEINNKFAPNGDYIVKRIIRGEIWIGMTDEMAVYSIGRPKSINSSVYSTGTHEQWVYYNKYLYFENGRLTSYQYTR
jgi:hypothetical protein